MVVGTASCRLATRVRRPWLYRTLRPTMMSVFSPIHLPNKLILIEVVRSFLLPITYFFFLCKSSFFFLSFFFIDPSFFISLLQSLPLIYTRIIKSTSSSNKSELMCMCVRPNNLLGPSIISHHSQTSQEMPSEKSCFHYFNGNVTDEPNIPSRC